MSHIRLGGEAGDTEQTSLSSASHSDGQTIGDMQRIESRNSPSTQSQIICTGYTGQGCGTLLVYPQGASNVRCALCNTITAVAPVGTDMAQLDCRSCRTRLMYARGASSVQCSVCNNINIAVQANQVAHCQCGGCGITLMYAYGAQSVKCAICNHITQTVALTPQAVSAETGNLEHGNRPQMVVVENPPTIDEAGQVVSNMAVGVVSFTPSE